MLGIALYRCKDPIINSDKDRFKTRKGGGRKTQIENKVRKELGK